MPGALVDREALGLEQLRGHLRHDLLLGEVLAADDDRLRRAEPPHRAPGQLPASTPIASYQHRIALVFLRSGPLFSAADLRRAAPASTGLPERENRRGRRAARSGSRRPAACRLHQVDAGEDELAQAAAADQEGERRGADIDGERGAHAGEDHERRRSATRPGTGSARAVMPMPRAASIRCAGTMRRPGDGVEHDRQQRQHPRAPKIAGGAPMPSTDIASARIASVGIVVPRLTTCVIALA